MAPEDRTRWRVPAVVRDVLLIVLGAGLALAADEWRDRRAEHRRASAALDGIRAEVAANRERVRGARSHHLAMIDTLKSYGARHELPPERIYYGGLFQPAIVSATAWQTARETGALADLRYDAVLRLARVYERQAVYSGLSDALLQSTMADAQREGALVVFRDRYRNFVPIATDFSNRERVLDAEYADGLVALDSLAGQHAVRR